MSFYGYATWEEYRAAYSKVVKTETEERKRAALALKIISGRRQYLTLGEMELLGIKVPKDGLVTHVDQIGARERAEEIILSHLLWTS